jgi:hypothetical protein
MGSEKEDLSRDGILKTAFLVEFLGMNSRFVWFSTVSTFSVLHNAIHE